MINLIKLQNEFISVKINSKRGSEIQSIKFDDIEYIWQRNPEFWDSSSPLLFPMIGRLIDGRYYYKGKEYIIPIHGFTSFSWYEMKVKKLKSDFAHFRLKSGKESLKVYPFKFQLDVYYQLLKNKIMITWNVKNLDKLDMFFQIGAHPGFNCNLNEDSLKSCFLEFEEEEDLKSLRLDEHGQVKNEILDFGNRKSLDLKYDMFDEDALIFKNLNSKNIYLKSKLGNRGLRVGIDGFSHLGIWTQREEEKEGNFICIEPWHGIAESNDEDKNIVNKKNFIRLKAKAEFKSKYEIEVF